MVALLCQSVGVSANIVHGKMALVYGPSANGNPVGVTQDLHAFVLAENIGAIDLSIKRKVEMKRKKYTFPSAVVYGNQVVTSGRGEYAAVKDDASYEQCLASASQMPGVLSAIYRFVGVQGPTPLLLKDSDKLINSPVTDKLRVRFGSSSKMYAALFVHLYRLLSGSGPSYAELKQSVAWQRLSVGADLATDEMLEIFKTVALPPNNSLQARRP
jgi:hypothetical protein